MNYVRLASRILSVALALAAIAVAFFGQAGLAVLLLVAAGAVWLVPIPPLPPPPIPNVGRLFPTSPQRFPRGSGLNHSLAALAFPDLPQTARTAEASTQRREAQVGLAVTTPVGIRLEGTSSAEIGQLIHSTGPVQDTRAYIEVEWEYEVQLPDGATAEVNIGVFLNPAIAPANPISPPFPRAFRDATTVNDSSGGPVAFLFRFMKNPGVDYLFGANVHVHLACPADQTASVRATVRITEITLSQQAP